MIHVMEDFEIMRNSLPSVSSTADRSFLEMENPLGGNSISGDGYGGVSSELRVFPVAGSAENMSDLEPRVCGKVEKRYTGYVEEKVKQEVNGCDEGMVSVVGEDRGSLVDSGDGLHGFRIGDMVWGKVKSHPWWPGHIFNEAFASPSVQRMKGEGYVLVAFFGDSSYGWFDPAELIPFETNYSEKSKQTTSRNFIRAVEEAEDEASRRGALAVACRCRNLHNFRPTMVSDYFAVDVVGYEPGGLYSSTQIKEARDNFVPLQLLSFVQQLAIAPSRNNGDKIEWIQTLAKLLAYRRSVFEEFDETYAQAFGVEPVRPSYNNVGVLDQTGRFTPRVAPLSGQLVVAEALGDRRSSTRLASHKSTKVSKNKYELKRRADFPTAASISLPGLPLVTQPAHHDFLPSLPDSGGPPAFSVQKREKSPSPSGTSADPSSDSNLGAEGFFPPGFSQKPEEINNEWGLSESVSPTIAAEGVHRQHDGADVVTKEKPSKRPREDIANSGEVKKKKKKKRDGLAGDGRDFSADSDRRRIVGGRPIGVTHVSNPEFVSQEDGIGMELPPGLELSSLQLPKLVEDLSSIALDPFYAIDEDAPAIVRHVFLRYRSLVYQKSLILFGAGEPPAPPQAYAGKDEKGPREPSSSSHLSKPAPKSGNIIKTVRKRDPSDRQEDLAAKKLKKKHQLKELASKKKSELRKTNSLPQPHPHPPPPLPKDQKDNAPTEAARKQEPPPPPRPKLPTPTYLIMKFPQNSALPSAANLKARFARFGPLDPLATRVYWKTYTCKVLFKNKSDAQSAYNHVKSNDLFGQVKVNYSLRDAEVAVPEQPPDHPVHPSDPSQYLQRPPSSMAQQSQLQLKSILKKPGGDDSGSNGSGAAAAASGARVKFMLKTDVERSETTMKTATIGGLSIPSDDPNLRPTFKTVAFSRGLETHPYRLPPPSSSIPQHMPPPLPPKEVLPPPPWGPPHRGSDFHSSLGRERSNLDISGPMLSLLLKCNDIVSKVKSSLGYTPYHVL